VDYIHYNPVKHGYTARASDWQYSSIHRYIAQGKLSPDWTSHDITENEPFGERQ
jgi:putative transposase